MPQLMPLFWVLSNFILFVVLMVVISIYSLNYYNYSTVCMTSGGENLMIWWW